MAPIMAEVLLVLKKARKLGLAITSVITPESYPLNKRLSQNFRGGGYESVLFFTTEKRRRRLKPGISHRNALTSINAERTKEKRPSSCKSSQTDGEKSAHFAALLKIATLKRPARSGVHLGSQNRLAVGGASHLYIKVGFSHWRRDIEW